MQNSSVPLHRGRGFGEKSLFALLGEWWSARRMRRALRQLRASRPFDSSSFVDTSMLNEPCGLHAVPLRVEPLTTALDKALYGRTAFRHLATVEEALKAIKDDPLGVLSPWLVDEAITQLESLDGFPTNSGLRALHFQLRRKAMENHARAQELLYPVLTDAHEESSERRRSPRREAQVIEASDLAAYMRVTLRRAAIGQGSMAAPGEATITAYRAALAKVIDERTDELKRLADMTALGSSAVTDWFDAQVDGFRLMVMRDAAHEPRREASPGLKVNREAVDAVSQWLRGVTDPSMDGGLFRCAAVVLFEVASTEVVVLRQGREQ